MSAFFVASSRIKDPEKLMEYAKKAMPTIVAFEGKLLAKGKAAETLSGSN
ncbi:hypothetical protein MNBD_ALPHA11-765, partial [hydrothermal vent metagenome]